MRPPPPYDEAIGARDEKSSGPSSCKPNTILISIPFGIVAIGLFIGLIFLCIYIVDRAKNQDKADAEDRARWKEICADLQRRGRTFECSNKDLCIIKFDDEGRFLCVFKDSERGKRGLDTFLSVVGCVFMYGVLIGLLILIRVAIYDLCPSRDE